MTISNYLYDGATINAVLETQGDVVPANTKRKLTAAIVTNDSAVAKLLTITMKGSAAGPTIVLINARTIDPGESYLCPELVGRGMNTGGFIQTIADVAGMDFKYEAFNITNG